MDTFQVSVTNREVFILELANVEFLLQTSQKATFSLVTIETGKHFGNDVLIHWIELLAHLFHRVHDADIVLLIEVTNSLVETELGLASFLLAFFLSVVEQAADVVVLIIGEILLVLGAKLFLTLQFSSGFIAHEIGNGMQTALLSDASAFT